MKTLHALAGPGLSVVLSIAGLVHAAEVPPEIGAHAKPVLTIDTLRFKDANANGKLDIYEDWPAFSVSMSIMPAFSSSVICAKRSATRSATGRRQSS